MPADTKDIKLRMIIEAIKRTGNLKEVQTEFQRIKAEAQKTGAITKKAGEQGAAGLKKTEVAAEKAKEKMEKLTSAASAMVDVGLRLAGIGAALTGAFVFPVATAARFQDAMAEVVAVTTGAAESYDELSRKASELGRTTKFTAIEAAKGMAFLGRAGFEAVEVIETIGPALQLAAAGQLELAEAADIASNVLSAFQLDVQELAHVADVLAHTAASSNTSVRQLGEAMSYAAPAAAAAGVTMDETAAAIGVLGDNGIQASSAGTALRGMLIALAAPTNQAKMAFQELGVTIEKQADGTIDLLGTLEKLGAAQMDLGQATAIFRRTGAAAALALSKQIEKAKDLTAANMEAAGAAENMAFTLEDTLGGAIRRILAAIAGLTKAFGDPLLAPIQGIIDVLAGFIGFITGIIEKLGVLPGIVTGAAGALGVLTLTIGGVLLAVGALIKLMVGLRTAMKAQIILDAVAAFRKFRAAITLTNISVASLTGALKTMALVIRTHPIFFAIGVLTAAYGIYSALATRTADLTQKTKEHRQEVDKVVESFEKLTDNLYLAEAGTEAETEAALALRKELLKVVEENEHLSEAALAAAQSIDATTGAIRDQNAAIQEFKEAAFAEKVKATTDELKAMSAELEHALDPERHGAAWALWNSIKGAIGLAHESVADYGREVDSLMARMQARVDGLVRNLVAMGKVDPTLNIQQFEAIMENMGFLTDENRVQFIAAFAAIRKEAKDSAAAQVDIAGKTTEEIIAATQEQVDAQVSILARLSAAYKDAAEFAAVAGAPVEAAEEQNRLYEEREKVLRKLDATVRALSQSEIQAAKETKTAAEEALETQKARGEVDTAEAKEKQLAIELAFQAKIVEAREHALEVYKQAGASEVDAAQSVAKLLVDAKENQSKAETTLDNHRAKMAVKARKEQLAKERALMEAQADLAKQRVDHELATLKDGYEAGVVTLDDYLERRKALTLSKTEEEIALLKKQIEAAAAADKPVLEVKLEMKEEEFAAITAELDRQDEMFRQNQIMRANDTELQLLGIRKRGLDDTIAAMQESHALELEEFDLQTENLLLRLEQRGASEEQVQEAKHLRTLERQQIEQANEERLLDARLAMIDTFTGTASRLFSDMYDMTGKKQKEFFLLSKAAASAQTAMSTAQAVMKAWSQGGIFGAGMAAMIAAQGAIQIAKILGASMKAGGPVVGGSGTKDDVPIMGMAGEFMQPKPAVKYYGEDVMEAIRRRAIPRSIFDGLMLPRKAHSPSGRYFQEGGAVGRPGGAQTAQPEQQATQEITMVNITDPREIDRYLATNAGQEAIINVISSRAQRVKKVLR